MNTFLDKILYSINQPYLVDPVGGAVEYTDCFSAEG